jgi:hypothetical protein
MLTTKIGVEWQSRNFAKSQNKECNNPISRDHCSLSLLDIAFSSFNCIALYTVLLALSGIGAADWFE